MPTYNTRYETPTQRWADRRRYFASIVTADSEAVSSPTITMLHPNAIPPSSYKLSAGALGIGLAAFDTMRIEPDLRLLPDLLVEHLQDDGRVLIGDLVANTVWTWYCDMGDDTLERHEFKRVWCGVQTFYAEPETRGNTQLRTLTMSIDLVHAGRVTLEALSMIDWCADVRDRIPVLQPSASAAAAITNPIIGRKSEWAIDVAYIDVTDFRYIAGQRQRGNVAGPHGVVKGFWIPHADAMARMVAMATTILRAIVREVNADFFLQSSVDYGVGTPWDFKTLYRRTYTPPQTKGTAIAKADRLWLAFVAIDYGSAVFQQIGTPISGLLHHREGLPALYENAYDYLKEATEEGPARGFFAMFNRYDQQIDLELRWFKLWDDDREVASGGMPAPRHYAPEWSTKRAAASVSGCVVTRASPVGRDRREEKYLNPAISRAIRPFTAKAIVTTDLSIGEENYYFANAPSEHEGSSEWTVEEPEGVNNTIINADFEDNLVVAHSRFNHWRWYYYERNQANGGPAVFNGASDYIPVVAHHHVDFDLGAVSGSYGVTGDDLEFPTFRVMLTTEEFNEEAFVGAPRIFYTRFMDYFHAAMLECQRRSDVAILARTLGQFFSLRSSTTTTMKIRRRVSPYHDEHPSTIFAFHPSGFAAGLAPNAAAEAIILDVEYDGREELASVTVYNRAAYQ